MASDATRAYATTLARSHQRRGHGRGRMLWVVEYIGRDGRVTVVAAKTLDECRREMAARKEERHDRELGTH